MYSRGAETGNVVNGHIRQQRPNKLHLDLWLDIWIFGFLEINALDFSHIGKQEFLVKILFIRTED